MNGATYCKVTMVLSTVKRAEVRRAKYRIVRIVMAITVASRRWTAHLSTEAGVTPRPTLTGGAGGTGRPLLVVPAACATI